MMNRVFSTAAGFVCCLATLGTGQASLGDTANWTTSDLDTWVYTNAVSPGSHALAPSFFGGVTVNQSTGKFDPSTAADPARLGTVLYAFNTGNKITAGLPAARYQVTSVTFKATWTYDSDANSLTYTDTPVSQQQILTEVSSGNVTRQKPMELYGAGLRAGYTGYEFGGGTSGPPLVDEGTSPYTAPDGGSFVYPIVGSSTQPGSYVDVSNSLTGGFSATEPSQSTAPFTPTPWAIGKTALSVGDAIPDNTTFTFSLDLTAPGVKSYVQQSLSKGALGLMLSSLTSTGEFGSGGGYPRWFTKESAGFPYFETASRLPQLQIDYTILPAGVPGDYNGNGVVDMADYVLWRNGGPLQNEVDSPGTINAQDYTAWRSLFGNTAGSGSLLGTSNSVPEPRSVAFAILAALWGGFTRAERNRRCAQ